MKRFSYKKYLVLGALLFMVVSIPAFIVEKSRGIVMRFFSPILRTTHSTFSPKQNEEKQRVSRLELENHLLRIEIGKLRHLVEQKLVLESIEREHSISTEKYEETHYLLNSPQSVVAARVIYRDPGNWTSSFWINVGDETNRILGNQVIKKNSPVLLGRSVIGCLDYVGKKQSRVRLLTDAALKPSVRAARGKPQNIMMEEQIDILLRHLKARYDLSKASESLLKELEKFKSTLVTDAQGWYLAKGILQGATSPSWRSYNHRLRGIGFNYDFADKEGPARELISGKPEDASFETMPILQLGDLLITTGMDGVFPPGLRVAEVTKIFPLREGAYSYEIEAVPAVGDFDSIHTVFVIPPLGYEPHDEPLHKTLKSSS